jgi:hypothetical protein
MTRALVFFAFFAGAAVAAPVPVLSADGIGPIAIGMSTDQLKQVLKRRLPYAGGCQALLSPTTDLTGISLVIDAGYLTRIDVEFYGTDPRPLAIKTEAGIGLKSSEDDLDNAYAGRARTQPAPLDPSWHTVYVDWTGHSRGMIFETDGKTVKSIRVGGYAAISSREPCK